jgi:hypothetical protein
MLGIDKVTHVKGAVDVAIMEGWGIRPSEVIEQADLPDLDDKYLFVQRYKVPSMHSRFGWPDPAQEIIGVWVVGFASIHVAGSCVTGSVRPKKKAFVLSFWPIDIFEDWQSQVCAMADRFEVSAVVPLANEVGMGLHLYDPSLTLASVDTFYARTLIF